MSSESTKAPEPTDASGSPPPGSDPAPDAKPYPTPSPTAPSRPTAKRHSAPWPEWLRDVAVSLCRWVSRPRVRLTVTGLILVLVGGLLVKNSMWTLPLVIAGAVMVVIAWVGHRLDGRLAVEWGETGAQLEFRAKMRAPAHPLPVLAEPASPHSLARGAEAEPEPEDAEVIEGEAHTVEIEVAELKALIAAAEAVENAESAEPTHAEASEHAARILRVAHGGGRSSDTAG
ncbi:MAG TPA: hypothetical protein VG294_05325 [Solirubrobacteraceae bacterium]|jgi:hypothetical protein|nr:hypothetical protein [Solirubrobacteraceae bacterium]